MRNEDESFVRRNTVYSGIPTEEEAAMIEDCLNGAAKYLTDCKL